MTDTNTVEALRDECNALRRQRDAIEKEVRAILCDLYGDLDNADVNKAHSRLDKVFDANNLGANWFNKTAPERLEQELDQALADEQMWREHVALLIEATRPFVCGLSLVEPYCRGGGEELANMPIGTFAITITMNDLRRLSERVSAAQGRAALKEPAP